ncbi:hypothetical protein ACL02O_14775 [Micromonospora sp. MS34]|uniref:hypothetical protein n=1 Tax=Micromonospora sp. MS34 TaxID=3385971 RepID=UPI0039A0D0C0
MTIIEKITLGVAVAGAFGLGSVITAVVSHLLSRRERRVNIADKSVQMVEAVLTRMETELTRAQESLGRAQQENEELRAELAKSAGNKDEAQSIRESVISRKLGETDRELAIAISALDHLQGDVRYVRSTDLDRLLLHLQNSPDLRMAHLPLYMDLSRLRSIRDDGPDGSVPRPRR